MPRKRARAEGVPDHELMIWTRRFAAMIDSGVSLMHAMDLLAQEETTPSLRAVTRDLMAKVETGATLSQAMGDWPQVFGEHYVGLVIFGEIGGILQIGLRRAAERMEAGLLVQGWEEGRPLTRADVAEWCWQFAHLLKAGVPPLHAVKTLTRTAHPALRRVSEQIVDELEAGGSLAPDREVAPPAPIPAIWRYRGLFSPTVRELIGFAVWFGPLDQGLLRVAELLEHEAQAERDGKLPPLPTAGLEPEQAPTGEVHIIREVNLLITGAVEKGAQWITMEPKGAGAGEATLTRSAETLTTVKLARYEEMVRRVKIMADIDPFAQEERRSQIHIRCHGGNYLILVHSRPAGGGGRVTMEFREDDGTVQL
jgi:hypothetical protein